MACLQSAAVAKQHSASPGLAGQEPEVMGQLRGIAAQYGTHGSLSCARSVWQGESLQIPLKTCQCCMPQAVSVEAQHLSFFQTLPLYVHFQSPGAEKGASWLCLGTAAKLTHDKSDSWHRQLMNLFFPEAQQKHHAHDTNEKEVEACRACAGVIQVAAALCPAKTVQVELVAQVLGEMPLADLQGRLLQACQREL